MTPPAALLLVLVIVLKASAAELAGVDNTGSIATARVASNGAPVAAALSPNGQLLLQTLSETLASGRRSLQEPLQLLSRFIQQSTIGGHPQETSTAESSQANATERPPSTTGAPIVAPPANNPPDQQQQLKSFQFVPNRNLQENIGTVFNSGARLLETPMRMFTNVIQQSANLTRAGVKAADTLVKTGSKLASNSAGGGTDEDTESHGLGHGHRRDDLAVDSHSTSGDYDHPTNSHSVRYAGPKGPPPEDDWKYYEYAGPYEPYAYRRPKYFSKECPFRFACEVGKQMKPMTYPVAKKTESSRFIQDLQNRYTRAMTYGTLRGDCERYYCVLVAMMGGPAGFARGVAEILGRALDSDWLDQGVLPSRRRQQRWKLRAPPGCLSCRVLLAFLNPMINKQLEKKSRPFFGSDRYDEWYGESYE